MCIRDSEHRVRENTEGGSTPLPVSVSLLDDPEGDVDAVMSIGKHGRDGDADAMVSATFSTPPRLMFSDSGRPGSAMRGHLNMSLTSPMFGNAGSGSLGLRSPFLNCSPRSAGAFINQTPMTGLRGANSSTKRLFHGLNTPGTGLLPPMFSPPATQTQDRVQELSLIHI